MNEFVSTKWLFDNLNDKNLVIFDCSWFLPSEKRMPKKDYKKIHIEGSHYFDINKFSDQKNKFPHMIPKLEHFKKEVNSMKKMRTWHKDDLLALFNNFIPNFNHIETGKYLDEKM